MNGIGLLHLYAQPAEHDDAWIVGNSAALTALAQAIQDAFSSGEGAAEVFVADGEGFTLRVRLDDAPMSSPTWVRRAVPYTDESAREHRPEAIWPGETSVPTLKVRVHLDRAGPPGVYSYILIHRRRWRMDIREVATIKKEESVGKVVVEFAGVEKEKLQDLVIECSGGSCSCGSEVFLKKVEGFVLADDGKTIEILGDVTTDEVEQTLKDWQKDL